MVKKLLKQEYQYYIRSLLILLPIVLLGSISVRIIQIFNFDHVIYHFIYISSMGIFTFISLVTLLSVGILAIVRFYKNMYSVEGYLTFSLPVNNHQHIIAKIIGYVTSFAVCLVVVVIAWLIVLSGISGFFNTIYEGIVELIKNINPSYVLMIFEMIILLIIGIFISPLTYYACMSIGQLAKKNRILLSVGAYYALNIITQIIITAISVFIMILGMSGILDWVGDFILHYPMLSIHIMLWIMIIIEVGIGAVFYYITYYIMTKKLNLE